MLKPLNDNIIIKFIEDEKIEKNIGGIVVFEKENNSSIQKAVIVNCGKNESELIKNDAEILINKYAAVKVPHNDDIFHIININDIVAVL